MIALEKTAEHTRHYLFEPNSFIPLAQIISANDSEQEHTAYYHVDQLGTPQTLSDENGEIAWRAEYKAWGEAQVVISDAAKTAGINNPLRFQGQYFDEESGLHYNRHRYYDPEIGRFISSDPIGLLGGFNTHAYAPNPVEWIDPYGLDRFPSWMPTKQGYQRQHIIPYSLKDHSIFDKAGMDVNAAGNMMYMPVCEGIDSNKKGYHRGWTAEHAAYNRMVAGKLDAMNIKATREGWDKVRTQKEISELQKTLRADLNSGKLTCASAKVQKGTKGK